MDFMKYVFEFDKTERAVWATAQSYWNKTGYFDDMERGKNFPDPIKSVLVCIMEACFEWNKHLTQEDVRRLLIEHGWEEIESGFQ